MGISLGVIAIVAGVLAGTGVGIWQGVKHRKYDGGYNNNNNNYGTGGYGNYTTNANTTGVHFGLGDLDFGGGTQGGLYSSLRNLFTPFSKLSQHFIPRTPHASPCSASHPSRMSPSFARSTAIAPSSKVKRFFRKMSSTPRTPPCSSSHP